MIDWADYQGIDDEGRNILHPDEDQDDAYYQFMAEHSYDLHLDPDGELVVLVGDAAQTNSDATGYCPHCGTALTYRETLMGWTHDVGLTERNGCCERVF